MTAALVTGLLGVHGFTVLAASEVGGELERLVETTADLVGCPDCGAVARAKDRRPSWVRDLPRCAGCGCSTRSMSFTSAWPASMTCAPCPTADRAPHRWGGRSRRSGPDELGEGDDVVDVAAGLSVERPTACDQPQASVINSAVHQIRRKIAL